MRYIAKLCLIWINWNLFRKNYLNLSFWKCQKKITSLYKKCGKTLSQDNWKKEAIGKNQFIILIINNMMVSKDLLLKC